MKKMIALLLMLIFCTTACAETEATVPVELMEYIGRPLIELKACIDGSEGEASMAGISRNYFEDGYTVYLKDYALSVRACIEDYPGYGWEPDAVFYIGVNSEEYTLFGYSIGDYYPDVDANLRSDGWTEMAEYNDYGDISFEKTIGDVRYMLDFFYSDRGFDSEYNLVSYIVLTGIRSAE